MKITKDKIQLLLSCLFLAFAIVVTVQVDATARGNNPECYVCVDDGSTPGGGGLDGPGNCLPSGAGYNGCSVINGVCYYAGGLCACPDPTVPCVS
jgi:hypothetical protein